MIDKELVKFLRHVSQEESRLAQNNIKAGGSHETKGEGLRVRAHTMRIMILEVERREKFVSAVTINDHRGANTQLELNADHTWLLRIACMFTHYPGFQERWLVELKRQPSWRDTW